MRRVAISIGVEKSEGLHSLPGALAGADQFSSWATAAGFEKVIQLDDRDGKVSTSQIYETVSAVVEARDADALFIYFAGHGISKGTDVDYWLLSAGPTNPNEAVNLGGSLRLARYCGIEHVVVFSDACRTAAGKDRLGTEGALIFPSRQLKKRVFIDRYCAALPGFAAQEVIPDGVDPDEARLSAYGIFSRCLLGALEGKEPDAIESISEDDGETRRAVTAHQLADYLWEAVPEESDRTPGAAVQWPDCDPRSRPPQVLSELVAAALPDASPRPPIFPRFEATDATDARFDLHVAPAPDERARSRFDAIAMELGGIEGRPSFETGSGLTVLGARVAEAFTSFGPADWFEEGGRDVLRGPGDAAGSVMFRLTDDRWVLTGLFPGFLGTILVGKTGVEHVSYLPAPGSRFHQDLADGGTTESGLRTAIGRAAAAVKHGSFDLAVGEAMEAGDLLRRYKHLNPTLGIFAAYAYDRAGARDQISSVAGYFLELNEFVPYDVAMLARNPWEPAPFGALFPAQAAPAFPMLTQGWAYLPNDSLPEPIAAARECLLPSLWATALGDGARALAEAIQTGEIQS